MDTRRVVVTGMGLVTPLGDGPAENWQAMKENRCGLKKYPGPAGEEKPLFLGKIEQAELPADLPPKLYSQSKFLNRGGLLGYLAARQASLSAAWPEDAAPARRSMYVATGDLTLVGYEFFYPAVKEAGAGHAPDLDLDKFNKASLEKVNPFYLLESLSNNPFSFLTAVFGFMGPGTCMAAHSPGGAQAMELAYRSILHGRAEVAMAVGCGSWTSEVPVFEMDGLGLLSRGRRGAASYRPLDARRDGFLPGEGGAALFLETEEAARRRGAKILARIDGTGNTTAALPRLRIAPRVTLRCMEAALAEAGCSPGTLGFICPHGSGTVKGDRSELESMKLLLENESASVPVCALKAYTGHMGAASDLGEMVAGILALQEGVVPATQNFEAAEPGFECLAISAGLQPCRYPRFLTVSYGLGGQASAILVSRPDGHS